MKNITNILLTGLALFALTACMNDFDEPNLNTPPYGNNSIGEPTMTISEFKEMYRKELLAAIPTEITDEIILRGTVVGNDETGNIYKQIVISDGHDAMIIGVNTSGLYSMLPLGQTIVISCKGLAMGGYCYLPQIGIPYNTQEYGIQIGRMSKETFEKHIKLIGTPGEYGEQTPLTITESYLSNKAKKDLCPTYALLENVEFKEANGKTLYVPGDDIAERHVKIGKQEIIFRLSNYADFAKETLPTGKHNIKGVLTRFKTNSKDVWQFMITSTNDIIPVEEATTAE